MAPAAALGPASCVTQARYAQAPSCATRRARSWPVSVGGPIARRQDSGCRRSPREKNVLAGSHARAMLARDLDLEQIVADGDVELERVAVIADVPQDAGEHVLAVGLNAARGDRHVLRANEYHDALAWFDEQGPPHGANGLTVGN